MKPGGFKTIALRWLLAGLAAAAIGLAGAGSAAPPEDPGRAGIRASAAAAKTRQGKAGRRFQNRRAIRNPEGIADAVPQVRLDASIVQPGAGGLVVLKVTLFDGLEGLQHASFDIGADPSQIRYTGFRPTGRGALLARESPSVPGLVSIYRSALPGGFDSVETLVELEFEILTTGPVPLGLTEVRLLDIEGRDMPWTLAVGDLHLE